jgi:hypothetical protein
MNINSHILKINGSVEIPKELTSGYNYDVKISGAVPKIEMVDNENGTFDVVYKMKPIKVEVINELGETLKAKDPRRQSELTRMQAKAIHMEKGLTIDFDTFYEAFCGLQRHYANDVAEQLIKERGW